jgi:inner membrane protein
VVTAVAAMDNVTHSLAGIAVAELAYQVRVRRSAPEPALRSAAWLSAVLASNAPDVDLVLAPLLRQPLGYLLHHRGHTHTLLLAPVLAMLPFLLARLRLSKTSGKPTVARDDAFLYGIALASFLLHLLMDFGNSYGLHPFWPFDSRWFFGDSMFIVEPLLLVTFAVPLFFVTQQRGLRITFAAIAAIAVLLSAFLGMVSYLALGLVSATTLLMFLASRSAGPIARPFLALFFSLVVELSFFGAHHEARIRAEGVLASAFPRATLLDVSMSPGPGNPLCWGATGIQLEDDDLVLRRFAISVQPSLVPSPSCRLQTSEETTAQTVSIERSSTEAVTFFDETRTSLRDLRGLAHASGEVEAYLRFSRAPFLFEQGDHVVVGDFRFDRERGYGFAEGELAPSGEVHGFVPPWVPPRIDAIDPEQAPPPRSRDIVTE